jgi:uncharacterized membrane protein
MAKRYAWLWTLPLLWVLAAALIVVGTRVIQPREDEELSYRATRADIVQVFDYQWNEDNQAPAWFLSFWAWRQLAGSGEFVARLHSILYALLAVALTVRMAREWFGRWTAGVFALILLLVSPFFMLYALEIRMYALVMCVVALSMWRFGRWLRSGTRRDALIYGVTMGLMLYTHYLLVFVIAAQVLYVLPTLIRRPNRVGQGIAAGVVGVGLWLPWLPVFIHQFNALQRLAAEAGATRGVGIHVSTEPTTWQAVERLAHLLTAGQPLVYGAALLIGAAAFALADRVQRGRYALALGWAVGTAALFLLANLVAQVYTPRYLAFVPLGVALAVGAGLARLRWVGWIGLLIVAALSLSTFGSQLPHNLPPRRDLFRQVAAAWQPGDVVYWHSPDAMPTFDAWYGAFHLPPDFMTSAVTMEEALRARRVWFVTLDWFGDGVRDAFDAIEDTRPLQLVVGDCTRGWCYLLQLLQAP